MAEGIFWIFISFFAALGIFDFFRMIELYVCRRETRKNILLIPIGENFDDSLESRVHTAVDFSHGEGILIADLGMCEENRQLCTRLCEQYDLKMIDVDKIPDMLKDIC